MGQKERARSRHRVAKQGWDAKSRSRSVRSRAQMQCSVDWFENVVMHARKEHWKGRQGGPGAKMELLGATGGCPRPGVKPQPCSCGASGRGRCLGRTPTARKCKTKNGWGTAHATQRMKKKRQTRKCFLVAAVCIVRDAIEKRARPVGREGGVWGSERAGSSHVPPRQGADPSFSRRKVLAGDGREGGKGPGSRSDK